MRDADLTKPFGAPHVFKGWRTLVSNGSVKTTETKQRGNALNDESRCEFCDNTNYRYIAKNGEKRKFNDRQDGDRMTRCNHAE